MNTGNVLEQMVEIKPARLLAENKCSKLVDTGNVRQEMGEIEAAGPRKEGSEANGRMGAIFRGCQVSGSEVRVRAGGKTWVGGDMSGKADRANIKEEVRIGRPRRISLRLIQEISKWLRQDASFEAACEACGVSHSTGYEWAKRGALEFVDRERGRALREEDDLYAEFFRATRQAQGQAECEDLRHIRKSRANWQLRS